MRIGVFDSGIGGVTVLRELQACFPSHQFSYFGDTANVPYGTKSAEQIRALSRSAAERMSAHGLDLLVVACNTASSLALPEMKSALGHTPVIGVVEAGVDSIRESLALQYGSVLILGTKATVASGIYGKLLRESTPELRVLEKACPLLVPIIEEGWVDHPVLHQTIAEYVKEYLAEPPGVAMLACTHYPWIRHAFARALPGWRIIDSAQAVARQVGRDFSGMKGEPESGAGSVSWNFSDPQAVAPFIFAGEGAEISKF